MAPRRVRRGVGRLAVVLLVLTVVADWSSAAEDAPSGFISGILAIVEWFPRLDRAIDRQIDHEKRMLLIKHLQTFADDLRRLENLKREFTDDLLVPSSDIETMRAKMRALRQEVEKVRATLDAIGSALLQEDTLDGRAVEQQLSKGLDDKVASLKDIERQLLGQGGATDQVDRVAIERDAKRAMDLLDEARTRTANTLAKLRQAAPH